MNFSKFVSRFSGESGIVQVMDDLGRAMSGDSDLLMLGGGNPAHIPEVQRYFRASLQRLIDNPALFSHAVGNYEPPQGNLDFINAIVTMINREYRWGIKVENVALTIGSQSAFFYLFNMFGGEHASGVFKRILLPIVPEYLGYTDSGLSDNLFYAHRPVIEKREDHFFKYHIDFENLVIDENTAAMCVSRPTNPTGNVLSDDEMAKLMTVASENDVPLIIDNAYGKPFPNIIFTDVNPKWNNNIIYCMSLSKVGLPGSRTGIVIADEAVITLIRNMNAIIYLAPANFGAMIAKDLIGSGDILRLSQMSIKPYYRQKAVHAVELLQQELDGLDYYIHKPEGAIFLWLWLPGLPITTGQLYERLKDKGVLVVPGYHFFPGMNQDWEHKHQCLRITHSMDERIVEKGIKIIAGEIREIMSQRI